MLGYTPNEIFEIAEDLEQNGIHFYMRATEVSSQENIRQLFLRLADMEEGHRNRFHALRTDVQAVGAPAALPCDVDAENSLYLHAVADMHVFTHGKEEVERFLLQATPLATLDFAIDREKDSIVLYLTLQEFLSPSAGREVLDSIMRDELQHIRLLQNERISLLHQPPQQQSGGSDA